LTDWKVTEKDCPIIFLIKFRNSSTISPRPDVNLKGDKMTAKIRYGKEVQQILYLCGRLDTCYKFKELCKEIDSILAGLETDHPKIILELERHLKQLQISMAAIQQIIQHLKANSS